MLQCGAKRCAEVGGGSTNTLKPPSNTAEEKSGTNQRKAKLKLTALAKAKLSQLR